MKLKKVLAVLAVITFILLFTIGSVFFWKLVIGKDFNLFEEVNASNLFKEINVHYLVTIEDKINIAKFKAAPGPAYKPKGLYTGAVNNEIKISYYFDGENDVTKEWVVKDRYILSGSAKYDFEGDVMVFSNITGNQNIFSGLGEVAIFDWTEEEILAQDKGYSFVLNKKGSEGK